MHSTALHPSPVKDGRRILGDKPANACLSPAHHRNVDSFLTATSPVKRSLFDTSSPKKLLPSPSFAGQKRSIEQVDDIQINKQRVESRHGLALQDENGVPYSSQKDVRSIQSSRAMDLDVSPKPQEQPQQYLPSTKNTQLNSIISHVSIATQPARPVPEDPETRKVFIQEKANLLRNRIQSAMRNVRDHQFDRRLSELEAHSRKCPRLSFPVTPPQHQHKIAQSIRQATTTPPSEKTPRQLLPAADLEPASQSTSNNDAPGLSSPPLSQGNSTQQDPMRTPTQKNHHRRTGTADSPMQLSSPPATVLRSGCSRRETGDDDEAGSECGNDTEKFTTPSQKGDAVDGLLKLMNTADRYENSDTWTG